MCKGKFAVRAKVHGKNTHITCDHDVEFLVLNRM